MLKVKFAKLNENRNIRLIIIGILLAMLSLSALFVAQVSASVTTNRGYILYPNQRKVAYEAGLWWAIYSTLTDFYYKTSVDGNVWSTEKYLCSGQGSDFAAEVNGTDFHYARSSVSTGLMYRKGTLGTNGYIAWVAAEQLVIADTLAEFPVIAVDSSNRPWVTYSTDADMKRYVTHSTLSNGTWSTAAGYPLILANLVSYESFPIVDLSSNQMYVAYRGSSGGTKGRLYNGTGWESEETISATSLSMINLVQNDDLISLSGFTTASAGGYPVTYTYTVHFTQRISGTWSALYTDFPTWSKTSQQVVSHETLTQNSSSVYLTIQQPSEIHIWLYRNSEWTIAKDIVDTCIQSINAIAETTANYELGLLYQRVDGTIYDLKFVKITTLPPQIPEEEVPAGPPTNPTWSPYEEEKPPVELKKPFILPKLGVYGILGAVGLVTLGGVMAYVDQPKARKRGKSNYRSSRPQKLHYHKSLKHSTRRFR